MRKSVTLAIHKTFFVIQLHDDRYADVLYSILRHLKSHTLVYNKYIRRLVSQEDKKYFSYDSKTRSYRFTIGILKDVLSTLGRSGLTKEDMNIHRIFNKNVRKLDLTFNTKDFTLRDYQKTYSNILLLHRNLKSIMLVDLSMGMGKSCIAAHAIARVNEVTMILVLPKYIEKWKDDLYKYTDIDELDICVIQGSSAIANLMLERRERLTYKVYIASITTMNYMISDFESTDKEYQYPMKPDEFMDHLGVGVILNDETHQHFHALLKISLYMNVNQIIGLSATLDSNRPEMKRLYSYMFPSDNRVSNIAKIESYTYVKAIEYRLGGLKRIRYTSGQGYSHILYEQSILRNKRLLDSYFEMIDYYVKKDYIDRKEKGERLLVFMSTVAMCTLFTKYLKRKYKQLDIRRYCQDDPYENVITAEISVSTIISASTAVDIPKLITVINTISMASLQANLQSFGRLRKIEGRDVWYEYLYTPQIPNQKNMHKIRRDTIMSKAKLIVYDMYPITLNV